MPLQFYIRVIRRDGTTKISALFDTLEEADGWRETVRGDPLALAAAIVQVDSSNRVEPPPPA